jgi:RimJ/RimL family protein N-acetyltransferase
VGDAAVRLRPGAPEDVDLLFAWANDPVARSASLQTKPIAYADHVTWYARQLATEGSHLFIALDARAPVAVVRLDRSPDRAGACTISINVAADARGRGLGPRILRAAALAARGLGFAVIDAVIRPDNAASIRAFERAGYAPVGEVTVGGLPVLRYALDLRS